LANDFAIVAARVTARIEVTGVCVVCSLRLGLWTDMHIMQQLDVRLCLFKLTVASARLSV